MASASISNFLSFFTPSKPPLLTKTPPHHFSLPTNRDGFVPIAASNGGDYHPLSSSGDLVSVVCPSLAYSYTLFFRSAYNVQVIVDDNEPEEKLLYRFRREVMRAGVIQECKRRRFFENKQDEKKRKTREAAKRNRRRRFQSRGSWQDKQEAPEKKKGEDEEDNWELPEGKLPY